MTHESDALTKIKPLPKYLLHRYKGWKSTDHVENKVWYRRLAEEGQRPRCMVISCCDSRVQVTELFGAGPGEFFMHRNIANLVPTYEPDGAQHGTSAALEYAVQVLKITNLIVLGHSYCGGVQGCHAMCSGDAPDLEKKESFVGRWLDILRPGFDMIDKDQDINAQYRSLEKTAVTISLENLMGFPFVREAVETENLALHGVWVDIAQGELEVFDPKAGTFVPSK